MTYLRWHCEGRECAADFGLEADARACAAMLQKKATVSGVLLLNENYEPLESSVPAT
jgi:hypothetical protein